MDTYGVAQYKEANPAVLTLVTFPFFFGVMFGDLGHGSLILMAGIYMIWNAEKLKQHRVGKMLVKYRYLFFMMGLMACYCGALYNEFFALKMNLFGSCFDLNDLKAVDDTPDSSKEKKWWYVRKNGDCTYPFGLDSVWGAGVGNELTMTNSVKMKLSVIYGVLHMSMGIFMKGTNMIYHGKWFEFFTEVVAGFLMLFLLFGWMDVMIIKKWF